MGQINESVGIKVPHIPTESTSNYTNLEKDIFTNIKSGSEIIKIDNIQIGDTYEGYCWAKKVVCFKNAANDDNYTVQLQLVDGNGRIFRATHYRCDHYIEDKETPIYVKGTNYIPINGKTIFWKLEEFAISTLTLNRSLFLKEISNLNEEIALFKNNIQELLSTDYALIINGVLDQDYINQLKANVYKDQLGTKLGYSFIISNHIIEHLKMYYKNPTFDINAIKVAAVLMHYRKPIYYDGKELPNLLPIDTGLYNLIMQSPLADYNKILLINILSEVDSIEILPERRLFKMLLKVEELVIECEELCQMRKTKW